MKQREALIRFSQLLGGATPATVRSLGLIGILSVSFPAAAQPDKIAALGRLEPKGGVIRVAGPSLPVVVIMELHTAVGERVQSGQLLAVLDGYRRAEAEVARAAAEVESAKNHLERANRLARGAAASDAKREDAESAVKIANALLGAAQADLTRNTVVAPTTGQVLEIHVRPGERLGPEGILELGQTQSMYAVAEVYETDITRVAVGQEATISSAALPALLHGRVERIALSIAKQDVLDTDPVARTDARVVEVFIRIHDGPDVSALTNLQVRVEIQP